MKSIFIMTAVTGLAALAVAVSSFGAEPASLASSTKIPTVLRGMPYTQGKPTMPAGYTTQAVSVVAGPKQARVVKVMKVSKLGFVKQDLALAAIIAPKAGTPSRVLVGGLHVAPAANGGVAK